MSLFSWFNSADQVDTALVVVAITGAIIEAGVAVAAVINVHKELEETRKEKLEKYIEVFACVAAFFFLAEAILGCRSSALLGIQVEKMKKSNLALQANVASLNGAVIQLAHQYDLSTNALAEANARLAATLNDSITSLRRSTEPMTIANFDAFAMSVFDMDRTNTMDWVFITMADEKPLQTEKNLEAAFRFRGSTMRHISSRQTTNVFEGVVVKDGGGDCANVARGLVILLNKNGIPARLYEEHVSTVTDTPDLGPALSNTVFIAIGQRPPEIICQIMDKQSQEYELSDQLAVAWIRINALNRPGLNKEQQEEQKRLRGEIAGLDAGLLHLRYQLESLIQIEGNLDRAGLR